MTPRNNAPRAWLTGFTFALMASTAPGAVLAADPDPSELFDPAAIARGLCGAAEQGKNSLSTLMQVAAVETKNTPMPARQPLYDGLGDYSFKITTSNPKAQAYFDQGLRLSFGFNHAEAVRAFKAGQELDPNCAMCFWGEAWALGPNINLLMFPDANAPAMAAIARAQELANRASAKERALINAMAQRYSADTKAERADLDKAFANAMAGVYVQYVDDPDVAVVFVEAAMDTVPWQYWRNGGTEPVPEMAIAYPALEKVLADHPRHPGAIHLYIHVMEQSAWPEKAEPFADTLGPMMPAAGHLVHMPSHTYFVIGRYKDSLAANIDAVAADEAFIAQAAPSPMYRFGYYPHNIHFALESAAMIGDGKTALAFGSKLAGSLSADGYREVAASQPIGIAPMLAALRYAAPDDILAIPDPGADVPFMQAMWMYARGAGYGLKGDTASAQGQLDALTAIRAGEDFSELEDNAVPATDILKVAEHVLRGRIAAAEKKWDDAVTHFEQAVAQQDKLPYMEPAYWYYPARQSLGAALLQAGRAKDAIDVLRESLMDAPNNGWALYVLAEASEKSGDAVGAAEYRKLFENAWVGDAPPTLDRI